VHEAIQLVLVAVGAYLTLAYVVIYFFVGVEEHLLLDDFFEAYEAFVGESVRWIVTS